MHVSWNTTTALVRNDAIEQGRSITAMIVKTVALTVVTVIGAEYLAIVRRQPNRVASYHVFATLIFPTFPPSDLGISIYRSVFNSEHGKGVERASWQYRLCAILDMRAIPEDEEVGDSIPLHLLPFRSVEPIRKRYDLGWAVRMLANGILLIQTTLTLFL